MWRHVHAAALLLTEQLILNCGFESRLERGSTKNGVQRQHSEK
jgi:hypothetical protein